jgi:hypothetical protein
MLYSNNYKIIEKFIEENIDMEKHAKDCPIYSEMMMDNWQ